MYRVKGLIVKIFLFVTCPIWTLPWALLICGREAWTSISGWVDDKEI